MKITEDIEKGLFAIQPNDNSNLILKFGRMKYNGKYKGYMNDSILTYNNFVQFIKKTEAIKHAKHLNIPSSHVERICSRFWSGWGIRHDFRDTYFLAEYD